MNRRRAYLAVSLLLVAGCAANKEARAPASLREPEPTTVEEAQAQIAQARDSLGNAPGTATAPPPSAAPVEAPNATAGAESAERQEGACAQTCRAITSMRHAVDALCRMAGNDDVRCKDAKKTLQHSEQKATGCGC